MFRNHNDEYDEIAAMLAARSHHGHRRRHHERLNGPIFAVLVTLMLIGTIVGLSTMDTRTSEKPNQPTSSWSVPASPTSEAAITTTQNQNWNYVSVVIRGMVQSPVWMGSTSPNVPDLSAFGPPALYVCHEGYLMWRLEQANEAHLVTKGLGGNTVTITETPQTIFPIDVTVMCTAGEEFDLYLK